MLWECRDHAWLLSWYSSWSWARHKLYWVEVKKIWGIAQERMMERREGTMDESPFSQNPGSSIFQCSIKLLFKLKCPLASPPPPLHFGRSHLTDNLLNIPTLTTISSLELIFLPLLLVYVHMHTAYKAPRNRAKKKFNKLHGSFLFP